MKTIIRLFSFILILSLLFIFCEEPTWEKYIGITVSNDNISFGSINVGQNSDKIITIENSSDSDDNLSGIINITGVGFSLLSGGGSYSLTPGQSKTVTIKFSPSSAQTYSSTLSITHNGDNLSSPYNVQLSGIGIVTVVVPTVTTTAASSVTTISAVLGGNVISDGNATVTSRGICYSTSQNPTTSNSVQQIGSGTGSFSATVSGLNENTKYYVRAYAINSQGTAYGSEINFTTSLSLFVPTVTTEAASSITTSSAVLGGNVTSDGNATVTSRGVCYSTSQNPTTSNSVQQIGSGTGSFSTTVSGLNENTIYYVRAYATNSQGTGYGSQISFTTSLIQNPPTVTTNSASNITTSSADLGGNVTSDGNATVTSRGVCYSTSQNPTTSSNTKQVGSGTGTFSTTVTGLSSNTTYYVRAYATNSQGTGYGSNMSFTTDEITTVTVTDIDGNVYQTIKIGNQWWMAENLKVTHYRNGNAIPNVTDANTWANLSTGAYCNYDNNDSNADTYGSLYNWYAVNDSRNIAPAGWHVPSDEEWKELEMFLGMSQSEADADGWRGTNEGSKLAGRADLWINGTLESNSEFGTSGFAALPAGCHNYDGNFLNMGHNGYFWSASEGGSYNAWARALAYDYYRLNRNNHYKDCGFSVRCVKD